MAYSIGDVDFSESVDIVDVILIISFIIGESQLTGDQLNLADINSDNMINILDITSLVNIILYD